MEKPSDVLWIIKSVLTVAPWWKFQNRIALWWCCCEMLQTPNFLYPFLHELFPDWSLFASLLFLLLRISGLNSHCLMISVFFSDAAGGMISLSVPLKFLQEHILSKDAVALLFKDHTGEENSVFSPLSCFPPLDSMLPEHPCYILLCVDQWCCEWLMLALWWHQQLTTLSFFFFF